jgi:hypothetical protein
VLIAHRRRARAAVGPASPRLQQSLGATGQISSYGCRRPSRSRAVHPSPLPALVAPSAAGRSWSTGSWWVQSPSAHSLEALDGQGSTRCVPCGGQRESTKADFRPSPSIRIPFEIASVVRSGQDSACLSIGGSPACSSPMSCRRPACALAIATRALASSASSRRSFGGMGSQAAHLAVAGRQRQR